MTVSILKGDCREVLRTLPDESVHCVVTSPPYFGLRDYGVAGQIGLEPTPDAFVAELVGLFRDVRRVLRTDGTVWLNLGDSYSGSGRGGNPDAGTKQGTNRGSQTVGVLYGRENESAAGERVRMRAQFDALKASGLKQKDLIGVPWLTAFALRADGWYLRQDIIWSKPNPMPESVRDRCTKAHEYIFMLTKSARYYYDGAAIAEPASENSHGGSTPNAGAKAAARKDGGALGLTVTQRDKQRGHGRRHAGFNDRWDAMERAEQCSGTRNKRSVWSVGTQPFPDAHFATFPPSLIEPCIKAGCPAGGTVLDPFGGAGTTGLVADRFGRNAILIELNHDYAAMAERRIKADAGLFADVG
jgi:DNA modification methylase